MASLSKPLSAGYPGTEYVIDAITLRPVALDAVAMERQAALLEARIDASSGDEVALLASTAALLFAITGSHRRADVLVGKATSRVGDRASVVARLRVAQVRQLAGELVDAEAMLDEVIDQCRTHDALASLLDFALQHQGKVLFERGRRDESLACFGEALRLRRAKADAELIASTELAIAALRG